MPENTNTNQNAQDNQPKTLDLGPKQAAPQVVSLNINKDDLKNTEAPKPVEAAKPAPGGIAPSKPSAAWGAAVPEIKKEDKAQTTAMTASQADTPKKIDLGGSPAASNPTPAATAKADTTDFYSSSSLQQKSGASKLVQNISDQKKAIEKSEADRILKGGGILRKSVEIEGIKKAKRKLRNAQMFLILVLLVVLGFNGFLFYQLSPGISFAGVVDIPFENNLTNSLTRANEEMRTFQSRINKSNMLIGQLYLNQFGIEASKYFDNVERFNDPRNVNRQAPILAAVNEAKIELPRLLTGAKSALTQPVVVDTFPTRAEEEKTEAVLGNEAVTAAKQAIFKDKEEYIKAAGGIDEADKQEIAFFDNAAKLAGNNQLITALRSTDAAEFENQLSTLFETSDPAEKAQIRENIEDLLTSTKVDLAIINEIKNRRIKWSKVLAAIERIKNNKDSANRQEGSETTFRSYDFSNSSGRVSVSGMNMTRTGVNRHIVSELVDDFNRSAEFKNAVNRSYPLTLSANELGDETYSMNFSLEFNVLDEDAIPIVSSGPTSTPTITPTPDQEAPVEEPVTEEPVTEEPVTEEPVEEEVVEEEAAEDVTDAENEENSGSAIQPVRRS